MAVKPVDPFTADTRPGAVYPMAAIMHPRRAQRGEIRPTITAAAYGRLSEEEAVPLRITHLRITAVPGNKAQAIPIAVPGVIQRITRRVLTGAIPIPIVRGIILIQVQEVRGVTLRSAIPPLEVPAVVVVSPAAAGSVAAAVIAVVADTEDGNIIRSSFYS